MNIALRHIYTFLCKNARLLCLGFMMCSAGYNSAFAQNGKSMPNTDSATLRPKADTALATKPVVDSARLRIQFNTKTPIPKRAAMYSALLPGLGQYYNKTYWRIPVVYAGFGVGAVLMAGQIRSYRKFQTAYIYRTDNNPATIDSFQVKNQYSLSDLLEQRSLARRNMDKIGVYSTVWYMLNIVDALASAHLKGFDISKNLSMQAKPSLHNNSIGIATIFTLKHTSHEYSTSRLW
jgi:hypothetical protein